MLEQAHPVPTAGSASIPSAMQPQPRPTPSAWPSPDLGRNLHASSSEFGAPAGPVFAHDATQGIFSRPAFSVPDLRQMLPPPSDFPYAHLGDISEFDRLFARAPADLGSSHAGSIFESGAVASATNPSTSRPSTSAAPPPQPRQIRSEQFKMPRKAQKQAVKQAKAREQAAQAGSDKDEEPEAKRPPKMNPAGETIPIRTRRMPLRSAINALTPQSFFEGRKRTALESQFQLVVQVSNLAFGTIANVFQRYVDQVATQPLCSKLWHRVLKDRRAILRIITAVLSSEKEYSDAQLEEAKPALLKKGGIDNIASLNADERVQVETWFRNARERPLLRRAMCQPKVSQKGQPASTTGC